MNQKFTWTASRIDTLIKILGNALTMDEAIVNAKKNIGSHITKKAIRHALCRHKGKSPSSYLGKDLKTVSNKVKLSEAIEEDFVSALASDWDAADDWSELESTEELSDDVKRNEFILKGMSKPDPNMDLLVKAVSRQPRDLRYLCDVVFKTSPKEVEKILNKARSLGLQISLEHALISLPKPEVTHKVTAVAPKNKSKVMQVGIISDIHFGSKYCMPEAVTDFIQYAYDKGIREILCPGDVLEGCYDHARYELTHVGWFEQAEFALKCLPALPGLTYHFIDGNHDFTFFDKIGMESGRQLQALANAKGRNDIHYYGARGATIDYNGTYIRLWHPKGGAGKVLSTGLQGYIREMQDREQVDIILAGHWHQAVHFKNHHIEALSCGTFQSGISPYGKAIGGPVAIGGTIMRWEKEENITNMQVERRYYKDLHTVDAKKS